MIGDLLVVLFLPFAWRRLDSYFGGDAYFIHNLTDIEDNE